MSYRSDLDAALARIDALERDNRELRAQNERLCEKPLATPRKDEARRRSLAPTAGSVFTLLAAPILGVALIAGFLSQVNKERRPADVPAATSTHPTCASMLSNNDRASRLDREPETPRELEASHTHAVPH